MTERVPNDPGKKRVRYLALRECRVGSRALVWPIDHPDVPMGAYVRTSLVQNVDPLTGVAETANTRYEPGVFADWSDMGQASPVQFTDDLDTKTPAATSSLFASKNDISEEPEPPTNFQRLRPSWTLHERRLNSDHS